MKNLYKRRVLVLLKNGFHPYRNTVEGTYGIRPIIYDWNFFQTKVKELTKKLKKIDILFVQVPWKNIYNFIDDAHYYTGEKAGEEKDFILTTAHKKYWASRKDGMLYLGHELDRKKTDDVYNIFTSLFRKNFIWDKDINKGLLIQLPKIKK